jgi:hypothetical protein
MDHATYKHHWQYHWTDITGRRSLSTIRKQSDFGKHAKNTIVGEQTRRSNIISGAHSGVTFSETTSYQNAVIGTILGRIFGTKAVQIVRAEASGPAAIIALEEPLRARGISLVATKMLVPV